MGDNPKKKAVDAKQVSQQVHELRYLAQKHDLSIQQIVGAVRATKSTSRSKIELYLKTKGLI